MPTVNILDAFGYKWGQTGTAEPITDDQWKLGWAFIGATPPSVEQFNKWGQVFDEKSNYLYAQMKAVFDAAGEVPDPADLNSLRDSLQVLVGGGRLLRISIYRRIAGVQNVSINGAAPTTSGAGTFTKLAGTSYATFEVTGAGGGSGGNPMTGASEAAITSGGGGGTYGMRYENGAMSGLVITVGAAGAAGSPGAAGGAGGASSVGALISCPGGAGSPPGTAFSGAFNAGVTAGGGVPTGANLLALPGGPGGQVVAASPVYVGSQQGGASGSGIPNSFGSGAAGKYNGLGTATPQPGNAPTEGGLIIIREYA